MKKRGFTLIELLAVIIILAIIALIATPIIMRVIENSKKGAAERSVENYIREVKTVALALKANGTTLEDGIYKIKQNGNICPDQSTDCSEENEIKIEMNGTKPSSGRIVISNGKVQATGTSIVIGDYTATINESGSVTAKKQTPRYYSWESGNMSDELSDNVKTDPSELTIPSNYTFYLRLDSADGKKIDAAYICFKMSSNGEEYCLKGNDSEAFNDNKVILDKVFPNVCYLDDSNGTYSCNGGLRAYAYLAGRAGRIDMNDGRAYCYIFSNGSFRCGTWY